jgi:serine protease
VTFTDGSIDSDGSIVSWIWDFGDGTTNTPQNPRHRYRIPGTYTITLTVTDDGGAADSTSKTVTVSK